LSVAHIWVSLDRAARGAGESVFDSGLLLHVVLLIANAVGPPFCLGGVVFTFPLAL
jgi:hypothetical protein